MGGGGEGRRSRGKEGGCGEEAGRGRIEKSLRKRRGGKKAEVGGVEVREPEVEKKWGGGWWHGVKERRQGERLEKSSLQRGSGGGGDGKGRDEGGGEEGGSE